MPQTLTLSSHRRQRNTRYTWDILDKIKLTNLLSWNTNYNNVAHKFQRWNISIFETFDFKRGEKLPASKISSVHLFGRSKVNQIELQKSNNDVSQVVNFKFKLQGGLRICDSSSEYKKLEVDQPASFSWRRKEGISSPTRPAIPETHNHLHLLTGVTKSSLSEVSE